MRLVLVHTGPLGTRVLQCLTCLEVTVVPLSLLRKKPKAGDLCSVCLKKVIA